MKPTSYEEWVLSVPDEIRLDSLWKMKAYRLSLFAAEMGWYDVTKLMQDRRTRSLADQLYRSLGSVGANLAEGYSRGTGKDRARFYEYALGSARESRTWYYDARHVLGQAVAAHRMQVLSEIIRLILAMVPQQRQHTIREQQQPYQVNGSLSHQDVQATSLEEASFLHEILYTND
ncbi:MAG TPA: four helix bundle protein [Rhodothermales bacterium]|nr:four helix bundle protein [Rhodothermales bacterium]